MAMAYLEKTIVSHLLVAWYTYAYTISLFYPRLLVEDMTDKAKYTMLVCLLYKWLILLLDHKMTRVDSPRLLTTLFIDMHMTVTLGYPNRMRWCKFKL